MVDGTVLPSSPMARCEDRFSLLPDVNDLLVPTWSLVVALLTRPVNSVEQLIEQLETFAICIHNRSTTDFFQLIDFLNHHWDAEHFLTHVYPILTRLALELPLLFPPGIIPMLRQPTPSFVFSRRQVACIVIHQFLCTICPPSWMLSDGSPDFHIWYTSAQPHARATNAYLYSLFTYFDRIASMSWMSELTASEWPISLTLRSFTSLSSLVSRFTPLTIKAFSGISTDTSLLGLPSGACAIFSNKYVGFGTTGTQEEMHIGCSPEAFPAVLCMPPLQDGQVLVLSGVEAMIAMEGHGRDARLKEVLTPDYDFDTIRFSIWHRRTMVFMDALELDSHDTTHLVPDLLPGHVERELRKAYTAFSSPYDTSYNEVVTGLWSDSID